MGPTGNPPHVGVKYVTGTPPQTPVLRPVRTRLYDREQVWGGITRTQFFCDNMKTADGRQKDETFTNMTQSGQLGYPLEFDAVAVAIYPVAGDESYAKIYSEFIFSDYVLKWFFGSQTLWLQEPISTLKVSGPMSDVFIDKKNGKPYRLTVRDGKAVPVEVEKYEATIIDKLNHRLITRYMNLTTPDRKARRISSTESFHGDVVRGTGPVGPPIDVYMGIEGILYRQL